MIQLHASQFYRIQFANKNTKQFMITEAKQGQITPCFQRKAESHGHEMALLEKKKNLNSYVSKLDGQINKALQSQNKAVSRKRLQLLKSLEQVKEKAHNQSERARKMEQYFVKNCQNILKGEVTKWDDSKLFFQELFAFYEQKVKEQREKNQEKKRKIEEKTKYLKSLMKTARQNSIIKLRTKTETTLNFNEGEMNDTSKVFKSFGSTRIKTEASLPSLGKKKMKTLESSRGMDLISLKNTEELKHYMRPIKTDKSEFSDSKHSMRELLIWLKEDRKDCFSWFEKLIFVDRNFRKIIEKVK